MRILSPTATLSAKASNGPGTAVNVAGFQCCAIQVTGTFTADVEFKASLDGVTFFEIYGHDVGDANHGYEKKVTAPKIITFRDLGGIQFLRADVANRTDGAVTAVVAGIG